MVAFASITMVCSARADEIQPVKKLVVANDKPIELEKMVITSDQLELKALTLDDKVTPNSDLAVVAVSWVKPGSPAEKAGIAVGMQAMSISQEGKHHRTVIFDPRHMSVGQARAKIQFSNWVEASDDVRQKGWDEIKLRLRDGRNGSKAELVVRIKVRLDLKNEVPASLLADMSR